MHQLGRTLAVAVVMLAAGCGSQNPQAAEEPDGAVMKQGNIGPVTFSYDARTLLPANVEVTLPPDSATAFGTKLLPARNIPQRDTRICFGAGGETHPCSVEEEPGLTFALLEKPFATYSASMRSGSSARAIGDTSVDGRKGLRLDAGKQGGLDVRYTIVPVEGRALLIKRQSDGETPGEKRAIAAVLASVDLPD